MRSFKTMLTGTVAVIGVSSGTASAHSVVPIELPTISVEAEGGRERGDGPVVGYRATRTTSGTKTDTPLKDIPQDIVVVPKQVLDDSGATTAGKALEFVGGVTKGNNFGGLNDYEFNIRGFPTRNSAKNGITTGRRYDAANDAANIERVEVMMGPSGALYGRSDPSGFYNIVTKKPLDYNFLSLTQQIGNFGMYRGSFDANAVLNADKTLFGRLNFAAESRGSFRDFYDSDRVFVAPVIAWQPSAQTRVTLEGEYLNDKRPFDRGIVAPKNNPGALPISRFLGEPNDGVHTNENALGAFKVEHDLNNDWLVRLTTQAKDGTLYGWTAQPNSILADGQTLTRVNTLRNYHWRSSTTQIETVGHFTTAGLKHTLLVGGEVEYFRNNEDLRRSNATLNPYSINIYNPVYGQTPPPTTQLSNVKDRTDTYSVYVSDQIEFTPRLKAQLGFRYDSYDQLQIQQVTGARITQNPQAFTPKAGVTYEIIPNVTLFADAAKSFRPNLDSDTGFVSSSTGQAFAPEKGIGYEGGAKIDLFDNTVSITAAGFHIVKENVLTPDPNNPGFSTTAGEVTSRGFDINVAGNITPEWRVIGGYAYVDARVTKDITIPVGSRFQNVPLNSGTILSVYEFQNGRFSGLGLGAGVSAFGARAGDNSGGAFTLPGYAKFDALAYYKFSARAKLSINVYNVFDKTHYERSSGVLQVVPGTPRAVLVSMTTTF